MGLFSKEKPPEEPPQTPSQKAQETRQDVDDCIIAMQGVINEACSRGQNLDRLQVKTGSFEYMNI
jgi:hypothetical protein